MSPLVLVADGLTWPESPRWHDGRLWFSDVHSFRLMRSDDEGVPRTLAQVPGRPAGIGFAPDGAALVATALDRRLVRVGSDGTLTVVSDLSAITRSLLNDMVVDAQGRAWVGDTGFRFGTDEPEAPGALLVVDAAGPRVAADGIGFPNGLAVTPDGRTLYLAETTGRRITAFDVADDGTLSGRRVHVMLADQPDGLCLDAEGCLWVPLLFRGEFQRISPQGTVLSRIAFRTERAISCVLGGADRRDLYLCVSELDNADPAAPVRRGAVYRQRADVAGAGIP